MKDEDHRRDACATGEEGLAGGAVEGFDFADFVFDEDGVGFVDEEPVVDHAGDVVEFFGELGEVF